MKKEILILGTICLFVGVGIQPAFAIDISKTKISDSDLVEITLQLCRTDGVEDHKMFITQEQDEQLDKLFASLKEDLDNAKTREETIEIYKDMVVSLDELGILPESTNCKEVQELVTGKNSISNYGKLKNKNPSLFFIQMNMLCLISGEIIRTKIFSGGLMSFGYDLMDPMAPWWVPVPAIGWVSSFGLLGIKEWGYYLHGGFFGIRTDKDTKHWVGAIGFIGIRLNDFIQGTALCVRLVSAY